MSEETRTYSPGDRVYEAIVTFEEARDAGLNPDWLIRYPDVAEALRAYFADAWNLRGFANPIVPSTSPEGKIIATGGIRKLQNSLVPRTNVFSSIPKVFP